MVSDGTMANGADSPRDDALRVTRAGGVRRDVWALVVLAAGIVLGLFVLRSGARPSATPAPDATAAAAPEGPAVAGAPTPDAAAAVPSTMPRSRGAKLRALRALGVTPERGPDGKRHLDAAPVIDALNRAGVHDGIAAFPPPGTDPPKAGVIVPDKKPKQSGVRPITPTPRSTPKSWRTRWRTPRRRRSSCATRSARSSCTNRR